MYGNKAQPTQSQGSRFLTENCGVHLLVLSYTEKPLALPTEVQARHSALMGVVIALMVNPVEVVGQNELGYHAGVHSNKDPSRFVIIAQGGRCGAHVMTYGRPKLS